MNDKPTTRNRLGPIAESYDELQSIGSLRAVIRHPSAPPPGSAWQAVRALYQSAEVVVVALNQLAGSATTCLHAGDLVRTARTLDWMNAFGGMLADLAWRAVDLHPGTQGEPVHRLDIRLSPNWMDLHHTEVALGDALLSVAERDVDDHLTHRVLHYVMLQRQVLEYFAGCAADSAYAEFVQPGPLRDAVLERTLDGHTVFGQFRAAHQVPEILVDAVNDHLEVAIRESRARRLPGVAVILRRVDRLLDAVVRSAGLLAENLHTQEYHEIRENLGLTSGSHSTGLHFHLMRDLYPQLRREAGQLEDGPGQVAVAGLIRTIGLHLDRWRLAHLNLPRNNLGGAGTNTRSLTGSRDAVSLVGSMRDRALHQDDPGPFRATDWQTSALAMAPVERRLLDRIAQRTQARFADVQDRSGYFAAKPTFQPPPERTVGTEEDSP